MGKTVCSLRFEAGVKDDIAARDEGWGDEIGHLLLTSPDGMVFANFGRNAEVYNAYCSCTAHRMRTMFLYLVFAHMVISVNFIPSARFRHFRGKM